MKIWDRVEDKEKERERRKDLTKLLEPRAEAQGRGAPQHWTSVSVSHGPDNNRHGNGGTARPSRNSNIIISGNTKISAR